MKMAEKEAESGKWEIEKKEGVKGEGHASAFTPALPQHSV